jgi:hypothetical protein
MSTRWCSINVKVKVGQSMFSGVTSFWFEFQIRAGQLPGISGKNDQAERVFLVGLSAQYSCL